MKTNKDVVLGIYAAFGVGDVPAILASVSEDFTWTDPSNPAIAPQGGTHVGRDGFGSFFQKLGSTVGTTSFEVKKIVAEGDDVVAIGVHGVTIIATGKSILNDYIMTWHFEHGSLKVGRIYFDTARYEALFK